jgi:hypothetical protein
MTPQIEPEVEDLIKHFSKKGFSSSVVVKKITEQSNTVSKATLCRAIKNIGKSHEAVAHDLFLPLTDTLHSLKIRHFEGKSPSCLP